MTTKYTPGPWEVDQGSQHIIPSNGGGMVADAAGDSEAQRTANATMIAASPDMLDELRAVREWMEDCMCDRAQKDTPSRQRYDAVCATIAKAEGRPL